MGKIVCSRDCPNRSVSPNCHNPDICEKWKKHLEEKEAIASAMQKEREVPIVSPNQIKKRAKYVQKKRRELYG